MKLFTQRIITLITILVINYVALIPANTEWDLMTAGTKSILGLYILWGLIIQISGFTWAIVKVAAWLFDWGSKAMEIKNTESK